MMRVCKVLALFLIVISINTYAGNIERPLISFTGEKSTLLKRVRWMEKLDQKALQQKFKKIARGRYFRSRIFDNGVRAAAGLWKMTGKQKYQEIAVRACKAMLGDYLNMSSKQLCAGINDKGALNPKHFELKNVCFEFAMLYYLTREKQYAEKSVALLAAFAKFIPEWKIYVPHYGEKKWSKETPQSGKDIYKGWDATGFWGQWYCLDAGMGIPLLEAYDLIYNSGEMQNAKQLKAIESMLSLHVEERLAFPRGLLNVDGYTIWSILCFEKILKNPEWIHACVRWMMDIYRTQFYADGWWHEGTPSYHNQIYNNLKKSIRALKGYSDPPGFKSVDGTRFDNLDLEKIYKSDFARMEAAVLSVQQPNRKLQALNDTSINGHIRGKALEKGKSYLAGCLGHAILATGENNKDIVQVSLNWGGAHGHEHYDSLNMILFAKGYELISETRYRPCGIKNTSREWHESTAGHNTVMIDNMNQPGRMDKKSYSRKKKPSDEVKGVKDWTYRWHGHGNNMNDGRLCLFNTDFPKMQVVEADARKAYGKKVDTKEYRRTVALVKINDKDSYIIDIFRVKGGKVHDYMLHSCLDEPYKAETSIPLDKKLPGSMAKYINNLKSAYTSKEWTIDFKLDNNSASLKSFFLPQANTQIIKGEGPAMRRAGTAAFFAIRQNDGSSTYVAVHHPYKDKSLIEKVELVKLRKNNSDAVALKIIMPDRVDTVISTLRDDAKIETADGKIKMSGHFAHIAEKNNKKIDWIYLIGGGNIVVGDKKIISKAAYRGQITETKRTEAGDDIDAFITNVSLPTGKALAGHAIMIDIGGKMLQSFIIKKIEHKKGKTYIFPVSGETGMRIDGDIVKLTRYPCLGIKGKANFKISSTVLWENKINN
jgi:heparinase II/III-like protein